MPDTPKSIDDLFTQEDADKILLRGWALIRADYEAKNRIGVTPDPKERALSDNEKRAENAYKFYLHYKDALRVDRDSEQGKQVWASMLTKFLTLVAARAFTPGVLDRMVESVFCRTLNKRYCRRSSKRFQELGNDRRPDAKDLLEILRLEGFFEMKDYKEWHAYITRLHDEKRIPTPVFEAFYFEFYSYGVDYNFMRPSGPDRFAEEAREKMMRESEEVGRKAWLKTSIEKRRPYLVRNDIGAFREFVEACIGHGVTREELENALVSSGYKTLARSADDVYGIVVQSYVHKPPVRIHGEQKGKIIRLNPPHKEE